MVSDEPNDLVARSDVVLEKERGSLVGRIEELSERIELHRALLEQLEVELAGEQRLVKLKLRLEPHAVDDRHRVGHEIAVRPGREAPGRLPSLTAASTSA